MVYFSNNGQKKHSTDPMCGTEVVTAAKREGRLGIGIDLNSDLKKIWKSY